MANTVIVLYESRTGNTRSLAEAVTSGVETTGSQARLLPVEQAHPTELLDADGLIVGSFTSYGTLGGKLKTFFDETAMLHGKLAGKVGGAFASSGGLGGGNEVTVLSILQILLVHGLIIQGSSTSPHFGVVSIGKPGETALLAANDLGRRVAALAARLKHNAL